MQNNRCGNIRRQKCRAKGSGKETRIQDVMDRYETNVEHEMSDCTSNNWRHQNINRRFGKNLEAITGKHSIDSIQLYLEHHT